MKRINTALKGKGNKGKPETEPAQAPPVEPTGEGLKRIREFMESEMSKANFDALVGNGWAFIQSVMQLVATTPDLQRCDVQSIYNAAEIAAILNLSVTPNLQLAHITAVKDDKGKFEAQFQMGWRGLVQLAQRTNQYHKINVTDVRAGELVDEDLLSGDCTFKKEPDYNKRAALEVIGFVSYFKLLSGFEKMVFWRIEKVKEHAQKYSGSYRELTGMWHTDFNAMANKTLIKDILNKWGPLSLELALAIQSDQAVIKDGIFDYQDNPNSRANVEINKRKDQATGAQAQVLKKLTGGK